MSHTSGQAEEKRHMIDQQLVHNGSVIHKHSSLWEGIISLILIIAVVNDR